MTRHHGMEARLLGPVFPDRTVALLDLPHTVTVRADEEDRRYQKHEGPRLRPVPHPLVRGNLAKNTQPYHREETELERGHVTALSSSWVAPLLGLMASAFVIHETGLPVCPIRDEKGMDLYVQGGRQTSVESGGVREGLAGLSQVLRQDHNTTKKV